MGAKGTLSRRFVRHTTDESDVDAWMLLRYLQVPSTATVTFHLDTSPSTYLSVALTRGNPPNHNPGCVLPFDAGDYGRPTERDPRPRNPLERFQEDTASSPVGELTASDSRRHSE